MEADKIKQFLSYLDDSMSLRQEKISGLQNQRYRDTLRAELEELAEVKEKFVKIFDVHEA